jgi:hypothetical protein
MANLRANNVCGTDGRNAITGSVEFDGSGDYLTLSYSNTDFDWWTASFTIEAWVYAGSWSASSFFPIVGNMEPTSSANNWSLAPLSTGVLRFYYFNGGGVIINSTGTLPAGQWNHIAVTHSSSTIRLFINGILDTSTAVSGTPQSSNGIPLTIGQYNNTCAKGFISNLRIIKGTALYTQNFIPPTRKLIRLPGTVLLCCQDNTSVTTEATGKTITANGNPAARRFVPQVGSDGGLVFDGVTKVNTQNYFYLPTGPTEQRSRGRGLFGGGRTPTLNTIDYINIQSSGIAQDFGDLTSARFILASSSSSTRGVFGGGGPSPASFENTIDYVTIATTSNALDFGDLTQSRGFLSSCSSTTRGLFAGGAAPTNVNTIDYITIASTGNANDFGDLTAASGYGASCSSPTRGIFALGGNPTDANVIDYITIASTGNAQDFGDLTQARSQLASCSSSTRGVFGGGYTAPTGVNTIDFITIASIGNASDFGDLSSIRRAFYACSSLNRGVFAGGVTPSTVNTIEYITISSTSNALDFGDLTVARYNLAACSDSHGGLG